MMAERKSPWENYGNELLRQYYALEQQQRKAMDDDDQGPSGFTLAEQIEALRKEIERRDALCKVPHDSMRYIFERSVTFKNDTECLRAALRTMQAMIDDGK